MSVMLSPIRPIVSFVLPSQIVIFTLSFCCFRIYSHMVANEKDVSTDNKHRKLQIIEGTMVTRAFYLFGLRTVSLGIFIQQALTC